MSLIQELGFKTYADYWLSRQQKIKEMNPCQKAISA